MTRRTKRCLRRLWRHLEGALIVLGIASAGIAFVLGMIAVD